LNAGGLKAAFLIVPQRHSLVLLSTLQIHFFHSVLYFRSLVECEASEFAQIRGDIVHCAYIDRQKLSQPECAHFLI
jgi:hypothetical protein